MMIRLINILPKYVLYYSKEHITSKIYCPSFSQEILCLVRNPKIYWC